MINHHWLRIRESRTQIFNCGVSTCSHYRIYVRKCQEKIFYHNMLPPYSNAVPAPEFHRSVALLLSSQSRIPFSGGYELVKLHSLTSRSPHPKNKKHRKTLTTQAGFLLSEDQPLTVLGSSMMLHHCLRLRDLSTGIILLWWFSLSELWNIYSHLSRVFFYLLITFPQNVLYTLNTHPAQPILCPVPWKTHYESFEVLEIISWGTGNTR